MAMFLSLCLIFLYCKLLHLEIFCQCKLFAVLLTTSAGKLREALPSTLVGTGLTLPYCKKSQGGQLQFCLWREIREDFVSCSCS